MSDMPVVSRPDGPVPQIIDVSVQSAAAASAEKERAMVECMYVMAAKRPRNINQFRVEAIEAMQHKSLADASIWQRPAGRKQNAQGQWEQNYAEGFSIRAMEAFGQIWGHLYISARVNWDDGERTSITVTVIDTQKNITYSRDAIVEKRVERKDKKGREVLGERLNSYGDLVYTVRATDDEHRMHLGAEVSKQMRDCISRIIPAYLKAELWEVAKKTIADQNAKDPGSALRKICDKFAALGVSPVMLQEYLGRPLETITANDLNDLAALHTGLKENSFTWADVMRVQAEPAEGEATKPTPTQKLRDKIANTKPPEGGTK